MLWGTDDLRASRVGPLLPLCILWREFWDVRLGGGAFTEPPHWAFWKMRIMTEDPVLTELGKKTALSSTQAPWSHVRGTQWLKGLRKSISWCFLMVHVIFAPCKECYIWGPEHSAKAHVRCVPRVVLFGGIRDLRERGILSHSGGGNIHLERTMGALVSSFFSSFPAISKQLCSSTYSAKMSLTTDTSNGANTLWTGTSRLWA